AKLGRRGNGDRQDGRVRPRLQAGQTGLGGGIPVVHRASPGNSPPKPLHIPSSLEGRQLRGVVGCRAASRRGPTRVRLYSVSTCESISNEGIAAGRLRRGYRR